MDTIIIPILRIEKKFKTNKPTIKNHLRSREMVRHGQGCFSGRWSQVRSQAFGLWVSNLYLDAKIFFNLAIIAMLGWIFLC